MYICVLYIVYQILKKVISFFKRQL